MPIQDNSPTRGYVRWHDVKVVYEGFIYSIKDGHTNNRYIYWRSDEPNMFQTGDIIPYTHTEIVFINNGGVITIYPSDKIEIVDNILQSNVNNDTLLEHIANATVHLTGMDKELLYLLSHKLDILENKVTADILKLDAKTIAIENEILSILRRLNTIEESLSKNGGE